MLLGEDFFKLSQYRCHCYNCTSVRQKRNGGIAEYGRVHLKIKKNQTKLNVSVAQFEMLWAWILQTSCTLNCFHPPAATPLYPLTILLLLEHVA